MKTSKTVIGAIAAILSAAGGYFSGELEIGAAINVVVTSVLAIFLRHGVTAAQCQEHDAGERHGDELEHGTV